MASEPEPKPNQARPNQSQSGWGRAPRARTSVGSLVGTNGWGKEGDVDADVDVDLSGCDGLRGAVIGHHFI